MSHIQCELAITRVTNLNLDDLPPHGNLFIRYYVYAGGGKTIRVDTQEILPCTTDTHLRAQSCSMECVVHDDSTKEAICMHSVVFELRWRRDGKVFGMKAKSKLLGRAEVAWNWGKGTAEKQVGFAMKKPVGEGTKPPVVTVIMGIRVRVLEVKEMKREESYECRCESCTWVGSEEDMFLAATLGSYLR